MHYDITVHRIVKQKKAKNEYIELHQHKFFHYIYAISGSARVQVGDHEFIANKGSLVMVPPFTAHAIYGIDNFISFDIKFYCNEELTKQMIRVGYFIKEVRAYEDMLIKNIFNEAVCGEAFYQDVINTRILELLFYIMRRKREGIEMQFTDSIIEHCSFGVDHIKTGKINMLLNYIHNNITKSLKISELAEICGYNENYFSTFFKDCVGCTPNKYINIKKVEYARNLMMTTDLNITQISEELGFESIHYFSKVFKKLVGIAPTLYMNRINMDKSINIVKDSMYTPLGEYEIPIKNMT